LFEEVLKKFTKGFIQETIREDKKKKKGYYKQKITWYWWRV